MKQRILITGASSGFGYLAAKLMRERGHEIVGTMRSTSGKNEEVAAELSSLGIHLVELDVTKDDSVNAGVEQVLEKLGGLDIVINNAGVGVIGMQEHFTPKDMRYLFEVNVFGVHRLLRAVLPPSKSTAERSPAICDQSFRTSYHTILWALQCIKMGP